MSYQDGIKVKVCNKCKVYIVLHDIYDSKLAEKAFDRDHVGHPKTNCLLSDIQSDIGYISASEKYMPKHE